MTDLRQPSARIGEEDALYNLALLSSIDDALISTDKNFIIRSWNKAAEKIYGIKAKDAIGKQGINLFQYEYTDTTREEAIRALVKENAWKGIVKLKKNDGKIIILQASVTAVKNLNKQIIGYVTVNRDITEEHESKTSLKKLVALLSALEESFFIVDRDLKMVFLSRKQNVERLHRGKYEIGDSALKYVAPQRRKAIYESYKKALSGQTVSYEVSTADVEEDYLWFHITYIPLKNDFGVISNVCVVIKDITTQKEFKLLEEQKSATEKRLFESRKLFDEFMDHTPLLGWITDEKGIITYMNPHYLKFFRFTKNDFGKSLYELFPPEIATEYFTNNEKVIQQNELIETIESSANQDGSGVTYLVYKFPFHYNGTTMVAGWAIDITEQVKLQEKLMELNEYKDKLVSVVAHDLKHFFAVNHTTIELLLSDYKNLSKEDLLKYLQILEKNDSRTIFFFDELTDWVKNALNKVIYNPQKIDIENEVEAAMDFLNKLSTDKEISIKTFYDVKYAFGDVVMFDAIIRNLLSNAIKFSQPKSEIILKTALQDKHVIISIRDNGVGMDERMKQKILAGLNYESTYGTKGEKGTGLGLGLVKEFVEKNGGTMWLESDPGKGSTFYFTVPLL